MAALSPPSLAQFTFCQGLTRSELHHLLRAHNHQLLEAVEEQLWRGVQALGEAAASSGAELGEKFAVDAKYELEYGRLEVFFSGAP